MYYDAFNKRDIRKPGIYRVEGIGHDFMVGTLDFSVIDEVLEVSDQDSFVTARNLARREGIFAGGSAGTAVWGALDVARRLGPGKVVVVIIPDSGDRYLSKCYDDEWMRDMGFLGPEQRLGTGARAAGVSSPDTSSSRAAARPSRTSPGAWRTSASPRCRSTRATRRIR